MTEQKTEDQKRQELREKIEAGEERNAQRSLGDSAREAAEAATQFVKQHPIAAVAGGIALGMLIAAIVPGPGRRLRRKATHRASSLASLGAELAIAYGTGLLDMAGDAARKGGDRLEDLGDSVGATARGLKRDAAYYTDSVTDTALLGARRAGRKASRSIRDLQARASH